MDNYKISYRIGSGSFANIYKATDIETDQTVAIKKIIDISEPTEADILFRLNHPNIISILKSLIVIV